MDKLITIKVQCCTQCRLQSFVDIDFPCNGLVYALFIVKIRAKKDVKSCTIIVIKLTMRPVFGCVVATQPLTFDTDPVALEASSSTRAAHTVPSNSQQICTGHLFPIMSI